MPTIDARGIINYGRTSGGDRFTYLVDQLIHAHCFAGGVTLSSIHPNLRVNIPDGGVDTRVDDAVPGDTSGWLTVPTVWQYKASEYRDTSEADLRNEILKESADYVRARLGDGYAYRYCVCDDMPDRTKADWTTWLNRCVREINPNAPDAMVLTASNLAAWANWFPPLVSIFTGGRLHEMAQHLRAWGASARHTTPIYISVPEWEAIGLRISAHVDLATLPSDAILAIQGEAGVGKTRLVYEMLASHPALEGFVYYTDDDNLARSIAYQLANDESLKAVLVADECSPEARARLAYIVQGHLRRVRVIAIDAGSDRALSGLDTRLERIPEATLITILEANFPAVPSDHLRAYVALSSGFVRLAADLCERDALITAAGHLGPVLDSVDQYLQRRLSDQELTVIQALSLVTRVGYKHDVARELDDLCALTGLDRSIVLSVADRLHDVPGFVARAGRYRYITPEIVAQVAFERAWRRWCEDDPDAFLGKLPLSLLEPFINRVRNSASEEVRRRVGDYFRHWATGYAPGQLANPATIHALVTLTEIDPSVYLPRLRSVIARAGDEELLAINGAPLGPATARRSLVWLAERLAAFPAYFGDAEAILLRLAAAENEPLIANNATKMWQQLFHIVLSGTALPFAQRLPLLRDRVYSVDPRVSSLGLAALDSLFKRSPSRAVEPPMIASRIPPAEWSPASSEEWADALDLAVDLLVDVAAASQHFGVESLKIAVKHARTLLGAKRLPALEALFNLETITDDIRVQASAEVDMWLRYNAVPANGHRRQPDTYIDEVRAWLERLKPKDIPGRLRAAVSMHPWHATLRGKEREWQTEMKALAGYLYQHRSILEDELDWLLSDAAVSASALGCEIGKLDSDATLLDLFVRAATRQQSVGLARGYVIGLLESMASPHLMMTHLNQLIDEMERSNPTLAYHLFTVAPKATDAFERTLRLVDAGKLAPVFLQSFLMVAMDHGVDTMQYVASLQRLVTAGESGDAGAVRAATDAVAYMVQQADNIPTLLDDERLQDAVWQLLDVATRHAGAGGYNWSQILRAFVVKDPDRAARLAVAALVANHLVDDEDVKGILMEMAVVYPDLVMAWLGAALLDEGARIHFYVDNYTDLFSSLPQDTVEKWLQTTGVEGARGLARHLPTPYVDAEGRAIVPPLTAAVLTDYGSDDRVFAEFQAGTEFFSGFADELRTQYQRRSELARKLLTHPLDRIRQWATHEDLLAHRLLEQLNQEEEERLIEQGV